MVLPWRMPAKKKRQTRKIDVSGDSSGAELRIPVDFRCPISLELMKDPVILSSGITYDRDNIERWLESGNDTCPISKQTLRDSDRTLLIPNHTIRRMIQDWCEDHRSSGIERIPTPRVPLTPRDVSDLCKRLEDAVEREDDEECLKIVGKIKSSGRESERNKKCLAQNGAVLAISSCFSTLAAREIHDAPLSVMSALAWLLPVRSEGLSRTMGSTASLRCMVRFLHCTDPAARQNAAFLIKEVVSSDTSCLRDLIDMEEASEGLVKLIRNPICTSSTKSSLMVIYRMISNTRTSDETVARFVELGMVSLTAELIMNSEKSMSEKALVVLDAMCRREKGREEVLRNDLMVPLLVKKLLRVSELATRCLVSILWKLVKKDEGVLVEALQVGAFEKLLVVLQVGCEDETKEKVNELLKSLNLRRKEVEMSCIDSSMMIRLKNVKRSF